MTPTDPNPRHAAILAFDPFQGDRDGPADREMSDKVVKCRKAYTCPHCKGPIIPGDETRVKVSVIDGEIMSLRWCPGCCDAMVEEDRRLREDDGSEDIDEADLYPFEKRYRPDPEVSP